MILVPTAAGGTWSIFRLSLLGEAKSAETPIDRLDQIARMAVSESDIDLLANLARNPVSDSRILAPIFDHCLVLGPIDGQAPCYQVFVYIAANQNTPTASLTMLAEARDAALLTMVRINRNTPLAALERLAQSPYPGIRVWVAGNPALLLATLPPLPTIRIISPGTAPVRPYGNGSTSLQVPNC